MSADDLAGVANEENWRLARVIHGDGSQPSEDIYQTRDGSAVIPWIQDPRIGIPYIAIFGRARQPVAAIVRRELPTRSLEEIRVAATAASGRGGRMRAIYELTLAAPDDYDRDLFNLFTPFFDDSDADVRGAASERSKYVSPSIRMRVSNVEAGAPTLAANARPASDCSEPKRKVGARS